MSRPETPKSKMWTGVFWAWMLLIEGISLFFGHAFMSPRKGSGPVSPTTGFVAGSIFFLGTIVSTLYARRRYLESKQESNKENPS